MTLARSRLDTPAGYWRVGDTDEYVDYWSPAAPTRWDNVDNMFDELRIRIAAVQETLVARELEPELDGSAAVEAAEKSQDFVDRLERQKGPTRTRPHTTSVCACSKNSFNAATSRANKKSPRTDWRTVMVRTQSARGLFYADSRRPWGAGS